MNKILFLLVTVVILTECGRKSTPVYKSENLKENIIIIS
jgi:hypothetical protein